MSRFCICVCYWDILVFAPGIYLYLQRKHELFLMRGACWSTKGGVDYSPTLPVTGSSLPCYHWYINGNAKRVTTYKETYICKCKCKLRNTREAFVFKKLSPSFSVNSVFTCCLPAQDRSTVWHREGWAEQVMVFPLSTTLPTVTTYRLPLSSDLFRSRWQKRMAVLSYHIIWDTPLVTDSLYLVICTAYPYPKTHFCISFGVLTGDTLLWMDVGCSSYHWGQLSQHLR